MGVLGIIILSIFTSCLAPKIHGTIFKDAARGNLQYVRLLCLFGGPNPEISDHGHRLLTTAAGGGTLSVVKYLIENGADINQGDCMNESPLAAAVDNNQVEVVRYILYLGTSPSDKFISYCNSEKPYERVVRFILENSGVPISDTVVQQVYDNLQRPLPNSQPRWPSVAPVLNYLRDYLRRRALDTSPATYVNSTVARNAEERQQ